METLFKTLTQRKRPEDIAQLILETRKGELTSSQERLLQKAAKGSLKRQVWGYSSMLEEFRRPVGLANQIETANDLFAKAYPLTEAECDDPEKVEQFVKTVCEEVSKTYGKNDFRSDRMNRDSRKLAGLDFSKRHYNKLWRHLRRMESKIFRFSRELKKSEFERVGKSGLASRLTRDEFSKNEESADFIAYYVSRCNLRSEFTIESQQRPYDQIAEMLMERCRKNKNANWWAIAFVYPVKAVLDHLTEAQKGELFGMWFSVLQEVGTLLQEVWSVSNIDRNKMIVRRGNDSTTWNNTAAAWNRARDAWMELVYALEMEAVLDRVCFGKVLRLIAGDVAAWHQRAGSALDLNTLVWREIPLPWEVLKGEANCTLGMIQDVCSRHGIDAEKTGWIAPRPRTAIAVYRPTPELVHGVTVSSPYLATLLKKAGYFSGKVS